MARTDIAICWVNVHGGSYHALFYLRDRLRQEGLSCKVFLSSAPPLGLQIGVDLLQSQADALAQDDIHILPLEQLGAALKRTGARLCLFDAHEGTEVPRLLRMAKEDMRAITVQASTLLADFTYHGADYALVQHPISLWFIFDYSRERLAAEIAQAKGIFFSGNIFYGPLLNTWTSDIRGRDQFLEKYGLDPAKPIGLWLPNREDGLEPVYGRILSQLREAGMNALVKLHPWEYKQLRHGFDPHGMGKTSAEIWGATAIDERDSSWAMHFCDIGVMRGSSMGLELPYWRKPGIYLPRPGIHKPWHQLLVQMTQDSSVSLDSVDALQDYLKSAWPVRFADAAYDASLRYTMPRGSGAQGQPNSLDLHVQHLVAILEGRAEQCSCAPKGSVSAVRRLFEPEIPPGFYARLRPWQQWLHAARRFAGLRPPFRGHPTGGI